MKNIVFSGIVFEEKKYGRKIGFPTANLGVIQKAQPGIYAGFAKIENTPDKLKAAVIVDLNKSLEIHILPNRRGKDFRENLYGKKIEVGIGQKIRDFQQFETETELIEQIKKDLEKIREILSKAS